MLSRRAGLRALAVALLGVSMFAISGCKPASQPAASAPLEVRLDAPFPAMDFAPFYVAKSKGWLAGSLARVGAKPRYAGAFGEIALNNEALATNRIDMLLTSAIPPIVGRSSGIDLKITWLSCILRSQFIVRGHPSPAVFSQLKGLRVGTLSGSDSQYWVERRLDEEGLSRDYLKLVLFTRPDDVVAAMESGAIGAEAMFPPFPEQSLISGKATPLTDRTYPIEVVMVARGAFVANHPDVVAAVNSSLDEAKAWIRGHPVEARAIVAKETGIPPNVVEAAWPRLDWDAPLTDQVVSDVQAKADFLAKEGKVNRRVDVASELFAPISRAH